MAGSTMAPWAIRIRSKPSDAKADPCWTTAAGSLSNSTDSTSMLGFASIAARLRRTRRSTRRDRRRCRGRSAPPGTARHLRPGGSGLRRWFLSRRSRVGRGSCCPAWSCCLGSGSESAPTAVVAVPPCRRHKRRGTLSSPTTTNSRRAHISHCLFFCISLGLIPCSATRSTLLISNPVAAKAAQRPGDQEPPLR